MAYQPSFSHLILTVLGVLVLIFLPPALLFVAESNSEHGLEIGTTGLLAVLGIVFAPIVGALIVIWRVMRSKSDE